MATDITKLNLSTSTPCEVHQKPSVYGGKISGKITNFPFISRVDAYGKRGNYWYCLGSLAVMAQQDSHSKKYATFSGYVEPAEDYYLAFGSKNLIPTYCSPEEPKVDTAGFPNHISVVTHVQAWSSSNPQPQIVIETTPLQGNGKLIINVVNPPTSNTNTYGITIYRKTEQFEKIYNGSILMGSGSTTKSIQLNNQPWDIEYYALLTMSHSSQTLPATSNQLPDIYTPVIAISEPVRSNDMHIELKTLPTAQGGLISGQVNNLTNPFDHIKLGIYGASREDPYTLLANPSLNSDGSFNAHVGETTNNYTVIIPPFNSPFPTNYYQLPNVDQDGVSAMVSKPARSGFIQKSLLLEETNNGNKSSNLVYSAYNSLFQAHNHFTLEMWIKTAQAGLVVSSYLGDKNYSKTSDGFAISIDAKGIVTLSATDMNRTNPINLISTPTNILNSDWHHIAFSRSQQSFELILDGISIARLTDLNIEALDWTIVSSMTFGQFFDLSSHSIDYSTNGFTGAIDEIRVWDRPLNPFAIRQRMNTPVASDTPHLLALIPFDANADDIGPFASQTNTFKPDSLINDSPQLRPEDDPYLIVQTKLMEDFCNTNSPESAQIDSYRVVVQSLSADGSPMPNTPLYLSSAQIDDETKAIVTFDLLIETKDGFTKLEINANEQSVTTDNMGYYSFAFDPQGMSLMAPEIRVRADFMARSESLLVAPDKHLHYAMSKVSWKELKGQQKQSMEAGGVVTNGALLNQGWEENDAKQLASTINNLMSSAINNNVLQLHPSNSPHSNPNDLNQNNNGIDITYNDNGDILWPEQNTAGKYQRQSISRDHYTPRSNAIRTHFTATRDNVLRYNKGDAMPDQHWQIDFAKGKLSFTPLSQEQVNTSTQPQADGSPPIWATPTSIDPLAKLIDMKNNGTMILSTDFYHALATRSIFSKIRDAFKKAASVLVSTVKKIIKDVKTGAEKVIHFVKILVKDAYDKVESFVAFLVQEAIETINGIFDKIGILVSKVIDFFKALFNWKDILRTQDVLENHLLQLKPVIKNGLQNTQKNIDANINKIKSVIDDNFDHAIGSLQAFSLEQASSTASVIEHGDVQAFQLQRMTQSRITDPDTVITDTGHLANNISTLASSLSDAVTENLKSTVLSTKTQFNNSNLSSLVSDPKRLLSMGLQQLLLTLKDLFDVALNLVKKVIDTGLTLLADLIDLADSILAARLNIPLITNLYENVINPGKTLTLYSLFTLLGAVPFTIIFKLANPSHQTPFSQEDANQLQNFRSEQYVSYLAMAMSKYDDTSDTSSQSLAREQSISLITKLSMATGMLYSVNQLLSGIIRSSAELSPKPAGTAEATLLGMSWLNQLTAFPLYLLENSSPSQEQIFDSSVWGLQFAFLIKSSVLFALGGKLGASVTAIPVASFGLVNALVYVALGVDEITVAGLDGKLDKGIEKSYKMLAGVVGTLPDIVQILNDTKGKILIPPTEILTYFVAGGINLGRATFCITTNRMMVVR